MLKRLQGDAGDPRLIPLGTIFFEVRVGKLIFMLNRRRLVRVENARGGKQCQNTGSEHDLRAGPYPDLSDGLCAIESDARDE